MQMESIAAGLPTASMLNHVHLQWRPPIKPWPGGTVGTTQYSCPRRSQGSMLLSVDVRGGNLVSSSPRSRSSRN